MRRFITSIVISISIAFVLLAVANPASQAQTYTVIHDFTNGADGGSPYTGLTIDAAENVYGTTFYGGGGYGVVFKLRSSGSAWIFTTLYAFVSGNDGANPAGRVVIADDGTLYGTTQAGAGSGCGGVGCGTVFHLQPSPIAPKSESAPWAETVLYRFTGGNDGGEPQGDLIFDQSGNIYGTTPSGGSSGNGVVYQLTPSGGGWTQTVLYSFQGNDDGGGAFGGVLRDSAGNLYGTTCCGGAYRYGAAYQLTPSGSGWSETTLHSFNPNNGDGYLSLAGLIFDPSGNLYGTTLLGGRATTVLVTSDAGTVFELTPANGSWTFKTLYAFSAGAPGAPGPYDKVVMDAAGSLYGTIWSGSVFKLTPSGGGWRHTSLHDFIGGSDGGQPYSNVVFDANGNLFGTTSDGGDLSACGGFGCGVVWEITP